MTHGIMLLIGPSHACGTGHQARALRRQRMISQQVSVPSFFGFFRFSHFSMFSMSKKFVKFNQKLAKLLVEIYTRKTPKIKKIPQFLFPKIAKFRQK
jgi:hypothetical protein